ncbi:(2Fe-2S)-binding protein [Enterobacter asburiae]|uniref:(2Fe-2S)-binding protein n=1 Tax=Enterobacter genomosp. O TaxID=2364150 RepID=UPI000642AD30|nr:(2Fe-2S)-binding protein [Enterobacter genomosp. O]EKI0253037.1 (2Fe-2S)-binding protein [Enterobacter asburiae]KLP56908.1 (2Fe-2S)-binding protein [Enterobacter genomosp. O]
MTTLSIVIDGEPCDVPAGSSVAAALALAGNGVTRSSVSGERRAPFCGMGVCQECRVTVNGRRMLACQTECQPDMVIERSQHANV